MDTDLLQNDVSSRAKSLAEEAFADICTKFPGEDLERVRGFLETAGGQRNPIFHPHQSTNVPRIHFPGLPAEPFYDVNAFPEAAELENAFETIQSETMRLLTGSVTPKAYESKGIPQWPKWKKLVFYEHGRSGRVDKAFEQFPETGRLVDKLVRDYEHFLSVGFLIQDGKMRLTPHIDWFNLYVSLWLPIIVPYGCGLEVAGQQREIVAGQCIAFDNSFLHTSWNDSDEPRIVFAIYRLTPRLSRTEAKAFAYIRDTYGQRFKLAAP